MTPLEAYLDSRKNGPSEINRKIVCKDSYWAYAYAFSVDQCPRDDTREAVCKDPYWAYAYAYNIDKCFHEKTYQTIKNTQYKGQYEKLIHSFMKEEII